MIICTSRIREWELQIWNWSTSVQHEIAPLFTISFQCLKKKKDFQKLAGLWLADEVVNHVGIYGSKAAEGLSAFQRRSCFPRASIKFQSDMVQNITDFDPNWAFPDCRPVAAFKSLRFALFHHNCVNWTFYYTGLRCAKQCHHYTVNFLHNFVYNSGHCVIWRAMPT